MSTDKEQEYEVKLSGEGLNLTRNVNTTVAQTIIALVMGGGNALVPTGLTSSDASRNLGNQASTPTQLADITAKQFLASKKPSTQIERIACLAYYLTHAMSIKAFKTQELTKLNSEAAQSRMANPTYAANDAVKENYLAPAGSGKKQITALGEEIVEAMPDKEKMKQVKADNPTGGRQRRKKASAKKQ